MRSRSSRREASAHEAHLFYPRLAWMGIKKNARLPVPPIFSPARSWQRCCMSLRTAVTPALYTVNGKVNGSGTSAVAMTMSLGSFVVSVFIALFLFYTNSFLLRRRRRIRPLQRARHGPRRTQRHSLLGDTSGRGVHADRGNWPRPAALLCLAVRTAAALSPRRGVHREPCRHQAVRHHVHRHLRAALCARCAVAAPCTGRGAFEERKRRRKAARSRNGCSSSPALRCCSARTTSPRPSTTPYRQCCSSSSRSSW